ncbi:unnamed protein product, partial [Polarella glacialis]
ASAFSFLIGSESASPTPAPTASIGFDIGLGAAPAAPAASPFGGSSAFSFLSSGSQAECPPSDSTAGVLDEQADTGPRKKTRKALLPGHASRSSEVPGSAGLQPPPPPEPQPPDAAGAPAFPSTGSTTSPQKPPPPPALSAAVGLSSEVSASPLSANLASVSGEGNPWPKAAE